MADQTSATNPTKMASEIRSNDGSNNGAMDTVPSSTTKPSSGEVTADENKRFLAEIVALHALSKVSDVIAKSITEKGPGGILIVDELDFAVDEIFYLDISKKLNILLNTSQTAETECQEFLKLVGKTVGEVPGKESKFAPLALIPGAVAGITALTGLLGSVGDIIGLFRSDYEIKGQTLTAPEDIYIQALVADRLRKYDREVYLIDFHALEKSQFITDLNTLIERKLTMLICAEKIKSTYIDVQTGLATALETYVANLREKLVDCLLKTDEQVIATLRTEIDQETKYLNEFQENRVPDSQITGLESYIATLRSKLAEELLKDNLSLKKALEFEIQQIVQQLAENENSSTNKKLSEAEVKALTDQLNLYQTKLVDLAASAEYNPKEALKQEIAHVNEDLEKIQKSRIPDAQITALETHIASLNGKLVDSLSTNDRDAKASLEKEITSTTKNIQEIRKAMMSAQGIVSRCIKISDAIDGFITAITTVPGDGKYPPYVTACLREYYAGERIKFILKLKLVASGADFIIEKPPFWSKDMRTSYLGGGVVSFILAEKDGKIIASDTVADVAALDHRIGDNPKEINWKIRPE